MGTKRDPQGNYLGDGDDEGTTIKPGQAGSSGTKPGEPGPSQEACASPPSHMARCMSISLMKVKKRTYAYCMAPHVLHCCSHG